MKKLQISIFGWLTTAVVMLSLNALSQGEPAAPVAEAITPQIQALAQGLQNDPVKIFNYVHDQIRYVHYFGSKKGAQLTLLEKSGNDFDQSALLVALLQAAGYANATYQFDWIGAPYDDPAGQDVDLRHWLQLTLANSSWTNTVQYLGALFKTRGYPGQGIIDGDSNTYLYQHTWVILTVGANTYWLDPSFKVSEPVSGINLASVMGFSSNAVMTASAGTDTGNYVTNLNEANLRGTLTGYTTNLLNYLQSNAPNASVQQILGGWQIVPSTNTTLSQIDQNFPFYTYEIDPTIYWTHLPTNLMASLKVTFAGTNYQWFIPQLQGQRLSLTFSNSGLAQLWQDDTLLAQRSTSGSGTTNVVFTINQPFGTWSATSNALVDTGFSDQVTTNLCQSTNATYVLSYAFEPDWGWLQQRQNQLDAYRLQGLADSSQQVVSETLNIMGLNWLLQATATEKLLAGQLGILPQSHIRFGRVAQEAGHGYYFDIINQSGNVSSEGVDTASLDRQSAQYDLDAYFASALEHGVIEQLQGSNLVASSTVKMLQLASTNGQAVYLASSTNWTTVKSKLINYDVATSNSIVTYINAGYYVLLPQNGSNHVAGAGSWAGSGYAARLRTSGIPMTNVSGMLISGGYHGGYSGQPTATPNTSTVAQTGDAQFNAFSFNPVFNFSYMGADPVDMGDGTFQVEHTDLSLGQAEPRGITLSRYYNGTRRNSNPAGMAGGWVHNYSVSAYAVTAPQASLGGTTPQQMAPMIAATCAAVGFYNSVVPTAKNWTVAALIAKWGIDQLNKTGVSVVMGKDTVQFVKQPDGSFTPPANCTMTLTQTSTNFILQQRHGNTFNFDVGGRLFTIVDPYNNTLSVAYLSSTSNLPQTVTDWKGRALTFNYTGKQLTSVSVNSTPGRTISYGYSSTNTQADLTSFTDAEGKTSTYAYDTNHQIVATFDALSRLVVSNVFDSFGHVALQYTQGDTNKTWKIFWSGWQNIEQDPAGGQRVLYYDNQGRVPRVRDALGNFTLTSFDGQNHVVMTISPLNETNQFIFDGNHNIIYSIDPLGFTNQFVFDTKNNLIRSIDPRGIQSTFGFNNQFSLTGATNGASDFLNYAFNTDGTPQSRTDAGGTIAFDAYDSYGQLTHITYPNGLGTESFANNFFGDVTSHTDGNGNTTTFAFSNLRQLTNSIAPTNRVTKAAFDPIGNPASVTDARGNVTSNTWSATRNILTTTLPPMPQGVPVVSNLYDNREWLIKKVDPLQRATLYTNDAAGRLISQTDPLLRKTSFLLDADGRKLASTNAAQTVTRQTWDKRSQQIQFTDGANHVSIRAYDPAGNQNILTNRNSKKWQFQFDGVNRVTNTISPRGFSAAVAFNHQGKISTAKDAANQTTTLLYDAKKRLTNRVDAVASTRYTYDANDNPTAVVENGLTNALTHDAYNQISSYKDVYGNLIQYRQDANGNVTNLIYPGGKNVYYSFDSNNHVTNVTDWSGRKTTITCDLVGQITSIVRPNGTYRSVSFDLGGQATNIMEQMSNSLPIAIFKLNWTNTGNMAWEFAAPLPHPASIPTRTMTYDDDNRLATFNGQTVYSDANGNLTNAPLNSSTFAPYAYDARNRLLNAGGVTNVYDAMNNRIAQTSGTNTTVYVVNPNAKLPQVLMRIKNGITNYYIYGVGLLYQITETATTTNTLTYHFDFRGSTVALTDDSGRVTDRIEYSAYGLTTYRTGTSDTPFLFNGRYGVMTDPNGLLYMQARYYNPYLCRFINPDQSGFAGGLNHYAYANGNPVSLIDPFGLNAQSTGDTSWSWMGLYNTVALSVVPGQGAWNNAMSAWQSGNYGTAALDTLNMVGQQVLFVMTLSGSGGATPVINNGNQLVHLTDSAAGAEINTSQVLQGNIYAGPLANANASGLGVTFRTGMSGFETAVPIPAAAEGAFSQITPIGPITLWQRLSGQQYTANGLLDLTTGAFTRTGVNWNQATIFGIDATITGGTIGAGTYIFSNP